MGTLYLYNYIEVSAPSQWLKLICQVALDWKLTKLNLTALFDN